MQNMIREFYRFVLESTDADLVPTPELGLRITSESDAISYLGQTIQEGPLDPFFLYAAHKALLSCTTPGSAANAFLLRRFLASSLREALVSQGLDPVNGYEELGRIGCCGITNSDGPLVRWRWFLSGP